MLEKCFPIYGLKENIVENSPRTVFYNVARNSS